MRVYAVSDVHSDHHENMQWVVSLSPTAYLRDVLICAGDVSDDLEVLEQTLALFRQKFADVFYTPGNHELWITKQDRECGIEDSVQKLRAILELCQRLGVHTAPRCVGFPDSGALWIVPMLAWHHRSWDPEPDVADYEIPPPELLCRDYRACKWPPGLDPRDDSVARYLDAENDRAPEGASADTSAMQASGLPILSFSHFLPRIELIPEKRYLYYPNLPKMVGSCALRERVQSLRPAIHVFGHTHFGWDMTLDGVRYIQVALAYPEERRKRLRSLAIGEFPDEPLAIYDTASGPLESDLPEWCEHYTQCARDPDNLKLAPWVQAWPRKARADR